MALNSKLRTGAIYLLVALAPAVLYHVPALSARIETSGFVQKFVPYVPVVAMLLLGLLGWKLNQTRIFWAALLMLGAWAVIRGPDVPVLRTLLASHSVEVTSIAVPLGLSLIFLIRETPLFTSRSLNRALAALTPFFLLVWLANWAPGTYDGLVSWKIGALEDYVAFPHSALIACLLFALLAAGWRDPRLKGFLAALAVTLIPVLFAAHVAISPDASRSALPPAIHADVAFLAVSVILLHAIFAMYWSRVYLDELTGIPNRRAFNERLLAIPDACAMAMIDVDHFKAFNDEYGHDEGDNVLRLVAKHLSLEFGDSAYRYGGEEFCVVFEGVDREKAVALVEKARKNLQERTFQIRSPRPRRKRDSTPASKPASQAGKTVAITFSAGVSSVRGSDASLEDAVRRADAALYRAKSEGRNRVAAG